MKKLFVLTLFFLSTTLLAQNIPSIEQVEAELEEFKKKDDLRAYSLKLIRQRDSLIEVFDRQISTLEQELSSTEASLSEVELDFDNAMTSIEALNQNKTMLENRIAQIEEELALTKRKLESSVKSLDSLARAAEKDVNFESLHPKVSSLESEWAQVESALLEEIYGSNYWSNSMNNDPLFHVSNIRLKHQDEVFYLVSFAENGQQTEIEGYWIYFCQILDNWEVDITKVQPKCIDADNYIDIPTYSGQYSSQPYCDDFNTGHHGVHLITYDYPVISLTTGWHPGGGPSLRWYYFQNLFTITNGQLQPIGTFLESASMPTDFNVSDLDCSVPAENQKMLEDDYLQRIVLKRLSASINFTSTSHNGLPDINYRKAFSYTNDFDLITCPESTESVEEAIYIFNGQEYILQESND